MEEARKNEPWWKTLFESGKRTVVAIGLMWGLMTAIGDEPMRPGFYLTMAGVFLAMNAAQRREGTLFSRRYLLVFGTVLGCASVILGAVGVIAREETALTLAVVSAVGAFLSIVLSKRAQTLAEMRAENLLETDAVPGAMPKEELDRRLADFRVRGKRATLISGMLLGGTLALTALGLIFGEALGFTDPVYGLILILFWVGTITSITYGASANARVARETNAICPRCNDPLLQMLSSMRFIKLLDELGRCPNCGARIVTEPS